MIFLLSPLRDVEGEVTDRPRDLGRSSRDEQFRRGPQLSENDMGST
ncbi:MAG: hypothetical protein ABR985_08895 [Methanotrichaceae archaeon]